MNEMKIGNTQRGVSVGVVETLKRRLQSNSSSKSLIDVPCGKGEFAQFVSQKIPGVKMTGIDFYADASGKVDSYYKMRAQEFFRTHQPAEIDAITCISGVMCFDGIEELFQQFHQSLKPDGVVVVTNDNFMTLRDRFNFLFFGRFKRFKLCYEVGEGNWNSISPQGVLMLLQRQKFRDPQIQYTSVYNEDYLLLPFALLIYPIFFVYLMLHKSSMPKALRRQLFPFKSMLARHYIVSAQK